MTRDKVITAVCAVASVWLLLIAALPSVPLWPSLLGDRPTQLEAWGAVTGAWGIWLTIKLNIWNWPLSIISSLLYALFFFQGKLYANTVLQFIYAALGVLGWIWWARGGDGGTQIPLTRATQKAWLWLGGLVLPATALCWFILRREGGEQPVWDGFTFVVSMGAQYLQSRKILENWWVWIFVDAVYVGLFAYERYALTTILYVAFTAMAVLGAREWGQIMRGQSQTAPLEGR